MSRTITYDAAGWGAAVEMEVQVKKHFAQLIAIGGLVILLSAAALAQSELGGYKLRAEIPFEFYAGSTTLPAGVYTFDLSPSHVVTVEQDSTRNAMFLIGMPADPVNNGKPLLTFKLMGSGYHLRELQGDNLGVGLAPVKPVTAYKAISAVTNESTQAGMQ